jgi:phage/conjugal plasmid C-4 type zinc finger TraR family protein
MADEADLAQIQIEAALEAAVHVRIDTHPAPQVRGPAGPVCRECGAEIPAGRLAAVPGACRCVECQGLVDG